MSNRLNQKRERELEPKRLEYDAQQLIKMGFNVEKHEKHLSFEYKGEKITLYPYSGWFTGKTVKDGRGIRRLIEQLK